MILRPLIILVVFFGTLFYFREPLSTVAPRFDQLHSAYSDSFKKLIKDITSATSSSIFSGFENYIPSPSGQSTSSSGVKTSTVPVDSNTTNPGAGANSGSQNVLNTSENGTELLPVISNQVEGGLSVQGIILATNQERQKQGLPYLNLNSKLQDAAEKKLQDMFKNQYFEHVSPSGESVSDVVRRAGYEYIVVGENLALGIFAGDEKVVAAWMASPGHRKNILDARYQEIGVAVGQGMYQGRKQWLIVQHFGKPLTACSSPSASLKKSIETQKEDVAALEANITIIRAQIDSLSGEAYVAKANEYNSLVINYNARLTQLKQTIDTYNEAAKQFNICAGI